MDKEGVGIGEEDGVREGVGVGVVVEGERE